MEKAKHFAVSVHLSGQQSVLCIEAQDAPSLRTLLHESMTHGVVIEAFPGPDAKHWQMVMLLAGPGMVVQIMSDWDAYVEQVKKRQAQQAAAQRGQGQGIFVPPHMRQR